MRGESKSKEKVRCSSAAAGDRRKRSKRDPRRTGFDPVSGLSVLRDRLFIMRIEKFTGK
jgi:hypothetical protein